jgi:hypothetical protein
MTNTPKYTKDGWLVQTTGPRSVSHKSDPKLWYAAARTREKAEAAVRARTEAAAGEEVVAVRMVVADKIASLGLTAGQVVVLVPDAAGRPRTAT